MPPTIRAVPSFDDASDASSDSTSISTRTSALSASIRSNTSASAISTTSRQSTSKFSALKGTAMMTNGNRVGNLQQRPSLATTGSNLVSTFPISRSRPPIEPNGDGTSGRSKIGLPSAALPLGGAISAETTVPVLRPLVSHANLAAGDASATAVGASVSGLSHLAGDSQPQGWDSAIGKAGLGKTGRVINKLVSDNEALKREIQIERLRADESRQAARLLEDKMERLVSHYESQLLEASVTKTLLARKERQVETLMMAVDQERKRAETAAERERSWREELDRVRTETTEQVERATTSAMQADGRYAALAAGWSQHSDMVRKIRQEISQLVAERNRDDDRINVLQALCGQQDSNLRALRADRDSIARIFDEYRYVQDHALGPIRDGALKQEREQEQLIAQTTEVLHKLRWALNVRNNVKDAQ